MMSAGRAAVRTGEVVLYDSSKDAKLLRACKSQCVRSLAGAEKMLMLTRHGLRTPPPNQTRLRERALIFGGR